MYIICGICVVSIILLILMASIIALAFASLMMVVLEIYYARGLCQLCHHFSQFPYFMSSENILAVECVDPGPGSRVSSINHTIGVSFSNRTVGKYYNGDKLTYECEEGHSSGIFTTSAIYCLASGLFSGSQLICEGTQIFLSINYNY